MNGRIRAFRLFTVTVLLLSLLVFSVSAAADSIFPIYGVGGDQINWTIDVLEGTHTRVLTISGTGEMYDKASADMGWLDRYDTVIIEEGITYVGASNFFPGGGGNSGMTVSLPSTLEAIGSGAFGMTALLKEITIPAKVTVLPMSGFSYSGLQNITIQGTILEIEDAAFAVCNELESFPFKEGLVSIGESAFSACYALSDVNLPASLQSIGKDAFLYCTAKVTVNNPNCVIADSEYTLGTPGTTVICGYTGSTAEAYALKYGYTFQGMTPGCAQGVHSYGSPVIADATCTTPGANIYACTKCGHGYQEETSPALDHDYDDEVIAATTSAQGYTLHTCQRCGHSFKDNFTDVHVHSYASTVVAPTCTEGGYTLRVCDCGESYRDGETEAPGHHWSEDRDRQLRICSLCGAEEAMELKTYPVLSGDQGEWDGSSQTGYTLRIYGEPEALSEVQLDGKALTPDAYSVNAGGTEVTLEADYLSTLSEGSHCVTLLYDDGSANARLTVLAPPETEPTEPETTAAPTQPKDDPDTTSGGTNPLLIVLWVFLGLIFAGAAGTGAFFAIRHWKRCVEDPEDEEEEEY